MTMIEQEKTICELHPSQILNLKAFSFALLGVIAVSAAAVLTGNNLLLLLWIIPIGYALIRWLVVRSMTVRITDQRIIVSEGVFNKTTNETELYRVRDSSIEEPFFFRLFKLGNISIYTTDESDATLKLVAFKKPHWIKDQVRNYSEICRQKRRWGNDNVLIHDHFEGQ
jgi:uncharacterized membrane protein YdbT with pleckstrin-like domain